MIVARKRCEKQVPILLGIDRAAHRKLMSDVARADAFAASQEKKTRRHIKTIRANQVETIPAPSQACRLNINVSESKSIKAHFGPIFDVKSEASNRRGRCNRQRHRTLP